MIYGAQFRRKSPEKWPGFVAPSGEGVARDRAVFSAEHGLGIGGLPVLVARPRRRLFAGNPSQVRLARRFVGRVLEGCPIADTAILLTDELVTNAIVHTRSGGGGSFEVIAWRGLESVCVAVRDGGSEKSPSVDGANPDRESGRGLALVDALATTWGYEGDRAGRVFWFLLR